MTMLYRKYRPITFAEVHGQETVKQAIAGALAAGDVGQAYLFSGPRGTGKTTMARLVAKVLLCEQGGAEPCNKCFSCTAINQGRSLDVIEIDAASHTGVDDVRGIIESAGVAAASGGRKIFIIDEVHMLSKSAFNALLKTLEEPSSHVHFILATTEPQKIPETVLSRVQRLDFGKLPTAAIEAKLARISKSEKLSLDAETIAMIARAAGGSLRDAESSLTKLVAYAGPKATMVQATAILGIVPAATHAALLTAIGKRETAAALGHITALHESGANLDNFAKQFIEHVRGELISAIQAPEVRPLGDPKVGPQELVRVIQRFTSARMDLKSTPIPQLPLELAVVDLTSNV